MQRHDIMAPPAPREVSTETLKQAAGGAGIQVPIKVKHKV